MGCETQKTCYADIITPMTSRLKIFNLRAMIFLLAGTGAEVVYFSTCSQNYNAHACGHGRYLSG
jgi:hypothetical protein